MGGQEEFSVSLVQDFCGSSKFMDASDIKKNDKTISWDGNIIFFNNGKPKKTGDEHKVPVQIKGQSVKELPKSDFYKRECKVSDLKNYYNNRGIIFILVLFDRNDTSGRPQKEMFASILLPANIKPLIEHTNQKKVTLELSRIENTHKLESLCRHFIENWPRQSILINTPNTEQIDFEELKISFLSKDNSMPPEIGFIESNYTYLYGIFRGIEIPIIFEPDSLMISENLSWDFEGEKLNVIRTRNKKKITTTIQGFIVFNNNFSEGKFNVKIQSFNSLKLDATLLGIKLILAMANNEYVTIDNKNLPTKNLLFNRIEDEPKKHFEYIIELGELLDAIGISKGLFYTRDVIDNASQIKKLYELLINRRHVHLNNVSTDVGLYLYNIRDLKFLCEYRKCDNDEYEFYDYFKNDNSIIIKPYFTIEENERHQTNRWFIIDPIHLPYMIIDRELMRKELEKVKHEAEIYRLNEYVLALINSYDRSGRKDDLKFAFDLLNIVLKEDGNKPYAQINKLQIKKRMGTFDSNDKDLAIKLKTDSLLLEEKIISLTCCACILLEQYNEFQTYFNLLIEDEQKTFCAWPIYYLFEKKK